jgi:hypothetical protein
MMDLSEDEQTVLAIAHQGGNVAPLGRWEPAVRALVARGLLRDTSTPPGRFAGDSLGTAITEAGTALASAQEDAGLRQVLELSHQVGNARETARREAEAAVAHLVLAVRASALATGDSHDRALDQWWPHVRRAVLAAIVAP